MKKTETILSVTCVNHHLSYYKRQTRIIRVSSIPISIGGEPMVDTHYYVLDTIFEPICDHHFKRSTEKPCIKLKDEEVLINQEEITKEQFYKIKDIVSSEDILAVSDDLTRYQYGFESSVTTVYFNNDYFYKYIHAFHTEFSRFDECVLYEDLPSTSPVEEQLMIFYSKIKELGTYIDKCGIRSINLRCCLNLSYEFDDDYEE